MRIKTMFSLTLFFFSTLVVNATTYYVRAESGDDLFDGLSPERAFASLDKYFSSGDITPAPGDILDIDGVFKFQTAKALLMDITIRGASKETSIIEGKSGVNDKLCFSVGNTANSPEVTFENVTFRNFVNWNGTTATSGGVLRLYNGNLICRNVNFINNVAYSGGAIYAAGGISLTLEDCLFDGNETKKATATAAHGGAIYIVVDYNGSDINVLVNRCLFKDNKSDGQGNFYSLVTPENSVVTIQNSTFTGNVIKSTSSGDNGNIVLMANSGYKGTLYNLINNTIAYNSIEKSASSTRAGIVVGAYSTETNPRVRMINNIIWSNYNQETIPRSVSFQASDKSFIESRNNLSETLVAFWETKTQTGASSGNIVSGSTGADNYIAIGDIKLATDLSTPSTDKTQVLVIESTSPAKNAGYMGVLVPAIDQTGNNRDATPDIGAHEYITSTNISSTSVDNQITYGQSGKIFIFNGVEDFCSCSIYDVAGRLIDNISLSGNTCEYHSTKPGYYLFVFTGKVNGKKETIKGVLR